MRENKGYIIICCFLTFVALIQLHESAYDTSIFDGVSIFIGTLLAAFLFFSAFFRALKRTDLSAVKRLIPLYFWVGSVGIVTVYSYWLNRIEFAPNFMHISSGSDFNIDGFTLKKDGRYIYWNGSGLGESRNFGTYIRQDSIINLAPNSLHNAPKEIRLVIRPYASALPAFDRKSRIFLIDKNGKMRRYDYGYNIIELTK